MFFLIYVSSASEPFSPKQLRELLTPSEQHNRRDHVTGMLLYKEGNFMQVLEGEEPVVHDTHARISRDPRHKGLITLLQGREPERQFPDWTMGFRNLSSDSRRPDSYSEFLNSPLTGHEFGTDPTRAQKLLATFKQLR